MEVDTVPLWSAAALLAATTLAVYQPVDTWLPEAIFACSAVGAFLHAFFVAMTKVRLMQKMQIVEEDDGVDTSID